MVPFYEDEHKTNELPSWARLTEVSELFGIPRNAIRSAARRAMKQEEGWVKKEDGHILIDTHHATYQSHARRWQEHQEREARCEAEEACFSQPEGFQASVMSPYRWYPTLASEGYQHWPAFCQWLGSKGLNVFFNLLAGEQELPLQWRWGDLHGQESYEDVKEAVIAALDWKLHRLPSPLEVNPLPSACAPSRAPEQQPQRIWPFGKAKRVRTR